MDWSEAFSNRGKKVVHDGEEYVLLQVFKRHLNLAPGIPNPFEKNEYDGLIYHEGRRAGRMVPVESLEVVPKDRFRRRLVFGEKPQGEAEAILMEV